MFPVLWQTLSSSLLKQLAANFFSIVIFLLLLRAEEIAKFASLGANLLEIGLLALHLIPMAMPLSFPLALMVATISVTRRLCNSGEYIALLTSGLSTWTIFFPLIFIGILSCCFNGWIASEWSAFSALSVRKLKTHLTLLSPDKFTEQHPFVNIGGNLLLSTPSNTNNKPSLYVISHKDKEWNFYHLYGLEKANNELRGKSTSLIKLTDDQEGNQEKLHLETSGPVLMPSKKIPLFTKQIIPSYGFNHLQLKHLFSRYKQCSELKYCSEKYGIIHEVARRLFCLLCPLVTLLIGIAWGLNINRKGSFHPLPLSLITLLIATYFFALHSPHIKTIDSSSLFYPYVPLLSGALFLLPSIFCVYIATGHINRVRA